MAFSSAITKTGVEGDLSYVILSFNSAGVTSGNIDVALKKIVLTLPEFATGCRAVIDDTTTAGRVALSGLTSGDKGHVKIYGYGY